VTLKGQGDPIMFDAHILKMAGDRHLG